LKSDIEIRNCIAFKRSLRSNWIILSLHYFCAYEKYSLCKQ